MQRKGELIGCSEEFWWILDSGTPKLFRRNFGPLNQVFISNVVFINQYPICLFKWEVRKIQSDVIFVHLLFINLRDNLTEHKLYFANGVNPFDPLCGCKISCCTEFVLGTRTDFFKQIVFETGTDCTFYLKYTVSNIFIPKSGDFTCNIYFRLLQMGENTNI